MQRVDNAIRQYEALTSRGSSRRGAFYCEDANRIYERNCKDGYLDMPSAVFEAMEAGFIIGYRYAKREAAARKGAKHDR